MYPPSLPEKCSTAAFLIDMMAVIHTMKEISYTNEEPTWKFVKNLPTNYLQVDIVADSFVQESIKTAERNKRGSSEKIIVQLARSKVPRNFNEFGKWRK